MSLRRNYFFGLAARDFQSSQVYFTIRLKVRRQEIAVRPCGHLHLLAILNSYWHQLNLVVALAAELL